MAEKKEHGQERHTLKSRLHLSLLPKEFIFKSSADSNLDPHLVTYFYPKSPISEQYRRVRESIKQIRAQTGMSTLAITSAVQGEGKSLTALNIAASLTQDMDCNKILLIDCDLRRGRIDAALGVKSKVGLSDYLLLGADIDNILYPTTIKKLTIVPRGAIAEYPTELLASEKMRQLIPELKKRFDMVLFDTPPVIPVADATSIGGMVEGVMLVIRAAKTQRGIVRHAVELLRQANATMIGYVLTDVRYYIPDYLYKYV